MTAKETKINPFRRRFPRRRFQGSTGVLWRGKYNVQQALEIGEGGMLISMTGEIEVGQFLVANFFISQRGFITVSGQVVYSRDNAIGVKFATLEFESKRLIREYIAHKTVSEFMKAQD